MSGFIRESLKLAPFLTCAHGAGGGGVGNSLGYQRGCTRQVVGGAEVPFTHWPGTPRRSHLDGQVPVSTEAQLRQAGQQ